MLLGFSNLIELSNAERISSANHLFGGRRKINLFEDTNKDEEAGLDKLNSDLSLMLFDGGFPEEKMKAIFNYQGEDNIGFFEKTVSGFDKDLFLKVEQLGKSGKNKVVRKIAKRMYGDIVTDKIKNIPDTLIAYFAKTSQILDDIVKNSSHLSH